jgi:hypothetical protein
MKDVAYCLTSCLTPRELERDASKHLTAYFLELRSAISARLEEEALDAPRDALDAPRDALDAPRDALDVDALEAEWRELYPLACADFYRFLLGWAGESRARDPYLESVTRRVIAAL